MAFVTDNGNYYTGMPFGLKNTRADFQETMNKAFEVLIGRMVEVYKDDIIVKSNQKDSVPNNLKQVFQKLRKINMKLNPNKCTFGFLSVNCLGFLVSKKGIEVNPTNISAIQKMDEP